MHYWPRSSIPADVIAGKPAPSTWGRPSARFDSRTCDFAQFFKPQTLIWDMDVEQIKTRLRPRSTLNGQWAGKVLAETGCSGSAASYVQDGSFDEAYFEVKSLRLYSAA